MYLLTTEVDADEEAYADVESHYAYSFHCMPERALTRSDFIQRSPACCLASPMEQETGTRESAALSASRERDRQEVKRKASSRHRIDRPGRSLAHRASEGRREKHVFVSLFSTKITSREQHSSCK